VRPKLNGGAGAGGINLQFPHVAHVPVTFARNGETVRMDAPGRLTIGVNGVSGASDLTLKGQGVTATFENGLQPHVKTGELMPLPDAWWAFFAGSWRYFPRRLMSAPLRAVIDCLKKDRKASADSGMRLGFASVAGRQR